VLPIWGLFWGLFAREAIGLLTCLGAAITVAGLVLLNLQPRSGRVQPTRDQQDETFSVRSKVNAGG
jgi:drug/metabolite transporter (DMT)-like permease